MRRVGAHQKTSFTMVQKAAAEQSAGHITCDGISKGRVYWYEGEKQKQFDSANKKAPGVSNSLKSGGNRKAIRTKAPQNILVRRRAKGTELEGGGLQF